MDEGREVKERRPVEREFIVNNLVSTIRVCPLRAHIVSHYYNLGSGWH